MVEDLEIAGWEKHRVLRPPCGIRKSAHDSSFHGRMEICAISDDARRLRVLLAFAIAENLLYEAAALRPSCFR